jgi:hypothetical protein
MAKTGSTLQFVLRAQTEVSQSSRSIIAVLKVSVMAFTGLRTPVCKSEHLSIKASGFRCWPTSAPNTMGIALISILLIVPVTAWTQYYKLFPATDCEYKPTIQWLDCQNHVPAAFNASATGLMYTTVPPTLHCGSINVPMDYSRPYGPDNSITVSLAMYRPKTPKGVIYV